MPIVCSARLHIQAWPCASTHAEATSSGASALNVSATTFATSGFTRALGVGICNRLTTSLAKAI